MIWIGDTLAGWQGGLCAFLCIALGAIEIERVWYPIVCASVIPVACMLVARLVWRARDYISNLCISRFTARSIFSVWFNFSLSLAGSSSINISDLCLVRFFWKIPILFALCKVFMCGEQITDILQHSMPPRYRYGCETKLNMCTMKCGVCSFRSNSVCTHKYSYSTRTHA